MPARNAGLSSHRPRILNNSKWPLSKFSRQAAPFSVRSTPDFRNTNEWNRRQSHDCSELFWLPRFLSRGSQSRHVILLFSRDCKWGDRFCVSNAQRIERYFEGLTAIYRHILIMLFERRGWAKSTSENVAKAYLDIQWQQIIIRCIIRLTNEYNNAWLHAYIIN
jgi:hypothetical protein